MSADLLALLVRKALRIDQELACDARVMARHADAKRAYAEAMLKTQLALRPVPLDCAWPPVGANPLKERITMLSRPLPGARYTALGAALCALATITGAGAVWIAQPPRVAYAAEQSSSPAARARDRQLVATLQDEDLDEARRLIEVGADVNTFVDGDGTPLVIAAGSGELALVELLIAHGANVNQAAPGDGNPLIAASANGHLEIVQLLIERGADVNGIVEGDETPLINAARDNRLSVARYLISRGANVNLTVDASILAGRERRSPMIMARRNGHNAMIDLLQANGARD